MAKDLRLDVVTSADNKGLVSAGLLMEADAQAADKLGKRFLEAAGDGGVLAIELEAVKVKSEQLARQFNETGDKALVRQISRLKSYEGQLQRTGKALDTVGNSAEKEGKKLGKDLAKGTEDGFTKWLSGANQGGGILGFLVTPQGLAVALPAATVLGVMAGGAILTGIGLAGIGVGIAAEFKDPAVASSLQGLKSTIGATLKDAAAPFIGPTIAAFTELGQTFSTDIGPGLKSMFSALAPLVPVLAHGLGKFASEVASGFEKAAVAAKPLLDVLGSTLLPGLGKDIAAVFTTIAHHSKEAEQGLKLLFIAIEAGLGAINIGINTFSTLFDYLVQVFEGGVVAADDFVGAMIDVSKALHLPHQDLDQAKQSLDGLVVSTDKFRVGADGARAGFNVASGAAAAYAAATGVAAAKTKALTEAWDALTGRLDKEQALLHAKDLIAGLRDQLDKSSRSLDANSAAGRKNLEALLGDVQDYRGSLQSLVGQHKITQAQADAMYADWIKQFEKAARKAGFTKSQIEDLNKQFGLIPKSKTVKIIIDQHYLTTGTPAGATPGQIHAHHHATGGPFAAGDLMMVGERGPELVQFGRGGTVIPNSQIRPVMPGGGGGGGGGGSRTVYVSAADDLTRAMFARIRAEVASRYSGDLTIALAGVR